MGGAVFLFPCQFDFKGPHSGMFLKPIMGFIFKVFKVAPAWGRMFSIVKNAHMGLFKPICGYFLFHFKFKKLPPVWGGRRFFSFSRFSFWNIFNCDWQFCQIIPWAVTGAGVGLNRPGPLLIMYFLWQKKINTFMYKTVPNSCYYRFHSDWVSLWTR